MFSDFILRITKTIDDGEELIEVDALNKDHTGKPKGLDFTPWEQWLGMEIEGNTYNSFTALEIICHSIYEMTFYSFDENEIKKKWEEIEKIVSDYNKNS